MKYIGDNIRRIRISKKLTQKDLSKKLDIQTGEYSKIERGIIVPSLEMFIRIYKALDISPEELFKNDEKEPVKLINESIQIKIVIR